MTFDKLAKVAGFNLPSLLDDNLEGPPGSLGLASMLLVPLILLRHVNINGPDASERQALA